MIRLFIALNIPEEIKKEIITLRNSAVSNPENYRWEKTEKLHLTLKFIGEIDESKLELILGKISFLEKYHPLNCRLQGFGFFFRKGIPKILWSGIAIDEKIYEIVDRLNKELEKLGIPVEERKFKSHLTLLRVKEKLSKNFIKRFENFPVPETKFTADEIVLIKSELLPKGSKYKEIKKYKLS